MCKGSYVLEIKLIEFKNPSRKQEDNSCCDGSGIITCYDCDPIFEGCVSDKLRISGSNCELGKFKTKEYENKNTVIFPQGSIGTRLTNPIRMSNDRSWKVMT